MPPGSRRYRRTAQPDGDRPPGRRGLHAFGCRCVVPGRISTGQRSFPRAKASHGTSRSAYRRGITWICTTPTLVACTTRIVPSVVSKAYAKPTGDVVMLFNVPQVFGKEKGTTCSVGSGCCCAVARPPRKLKTTNTKTATTSKRLRTFSIVNSISNSGSGYSTPEPSENGNKTAPVKTFFLGPGFRRKHGLPSFASSALANSSPAQGC